MTKQELIVYAKQFKKTKTLKLIAYVVMKRRNTYSLDEALGHICYTLSEDYNVGRELSWFNTWEQYINLQIRRGKTSITNILTLNTKI